MLTLNKPKTIRNRLYTIAETIALLETNRESLRQWRKAGLLKETPVKVKYVTSAGNVGERIQKGFFGRDIENFHDLYAKVLS